jgi:hypothetical protein
LNAVTAHTSTTKGIYVREVTLLAHFDVIVCVIGHGLKFMLNPNETVENEGDQCR